MTQLVTPDPPHSHALRGNVVITLRLLFWETTAACNLRCRHCRRLDEVDRPLPGELTTQEAKKFLQDISKIAQPILVLSGGEPILRRDLFELAEYTVCELKMEVALATNGTFVNKWMAVKIASSGIRRVAISIDGADAETHDRFRGQAGAFDSALRGWNYLREEGLSLQMNTTVSLHNAHQLPKFYELAKNLQADAIHFFFAIPVGCGLGMNRDQFLSPQEMEDALGKIYELTQKDELVAKPTCAPQYFRIMVQKRKNNFFHPPPNPLPSREGEEDKKESALFYPSLLMGEGQGGGEKEGGKDSISPWTKGCLAGTGIGFVSSCGDVFPCGYLPTKVGNVKEIPFDKIWQEAPILNQLRDSTLLEGKCGVCSFRAICGGCRARAWAERQNFLAEDPACSFIP